MSALIGAPALGLAMIKHKNEIIARKGLGMGAKNINREVRSTVTKQEATITQQAKEIEALTATVKEQAS
jgi:hypothetical protein